MGAFRKNWWGRAAVTARGRRPPRSATWPVVRVCGAKGNRLLLVFVNDTSHGPNEMATDLMWCSR